MRRESILSTLALRLLAHPSIRNLLMMRAATSTVPSRQHPYIFLPFITFSSVDGHCLQVMSAPIPSSSSSNAITSSSSSQLPSSSFRKHRATTPDDSADSKKTRMCKSAYGALDGMSAAICDLTKAFNQPATAASEPSLFDDPHSRLQSVICNDGETAVIEGGSCWV